MKVITFFTDPYEDELLYGTISRYHYYIGNIDYKDTLQELFGKSSIIPSLYLHSNIQYLSDQLGSKYTPEHLIYNHTIFPYYAPFLPEQRKEEMISDMKGDGGKSIYMKIGMTAGSICVKDGIYYCYFCSLKDLEDHGEVYIHRVHQIQGVLVCPIHQVKLRRFIVNKTNSSRLEFIRLDERYMNFNREEEKNDRINEELIRIAQSAKFLLSNNIETFNKEKVYSNYKKLLDKKEFLSVGKSIKQNILANSLISYYSEELLELLESTIVKEDEYNWLKVLSRNSSRTVHPLRHILLINFLDDINNFFKKNVRHYRPFGKEPWPCLNPVAKHYKMDVVTDIKITSDYKTREPVGTFSCYCGFIYSRKGPDETKDDRYRIGRIKEFGSEWEEVLKSYLNEGRYGLRELSRKMECDPKTILKYDKKMKIYWFDRYRKLEDKEESKANSKYKINMDEYKNIVLNAIKENPYMNRTQIRKLFGKQYNYVYRFEREWLEEILPAKRMFDNNKKEVVDWNKRDKEILGLVQSKTKELAIDTNIQRITLTRIGKELGILSLLEKSLNKLPMTKKFIEISTESVKDFQIRRSIQIIDEKLENDDEIRLWEVQKIAGIRTGPFIEIQGILKDYLDRGYQH